MHGVEFVASVLETDLTLYEQAMAYLSDKTERIQVDFADNTLVDNRTLLPRQLQKLPDYFEADAHLMVAEPSKYMGELDELGFQRIIIHAEAAESIGDCLAAAREYNLGVAVTLHPETPLAVVLPFVDEIDFLQLMGVEPGFGGQEMLPETFDRLKLARELFPDLILAVDGGVRLSNAPDLIQCGAGILVVGKTGYAGPLFPQWQDLL